VFRRNIYLKKVVTQRDGSHQINLYGHNAGILNVTACGTYSECWTLNGKWHH